MKFLKKNLYSYISKKFMDGCTNYNSLEVRKSCRSKEQARDTFAANDIPHAKGEIFLNPLTAHKFAKEHGFPLVIKPNVGGFSRGSYFPIKNFKELWKAIFLAKIWWPTSVVEQYLEGKNYRVLVANGKVVSVIERFAPFVKGNGQNTISELIDEENEIRRKMGLFGCMSPLQKSTQTTDFLARSNYDLNSIPAENEHVKLFHRIALAPGGVVEAISQKEVAADNLVLMEKTIKAFGANILGIDVILEKGIDVSHKDQKCILLEVNSRPYVKMHDYPRYGEKDDLTAVFAELEQLEIQGADVF
ncbi:cyanophycin synthetase [Endozoicomonas sp. OPT23]|uniref:cyanophycin synthetase n=1 Tax=Endozoicomonas sp. OPT23 TaxID=2072845 RepID=UPI001D254C79|nr:cyanophycin synthetase [Endozoicomonas sp. OPT23]